MLREPSPVLSQKTDFHREMRWVQGPWSEIFVEKEQGDYTITMDDRDNGVFYVIEGEGNLWGVGEDRRSTVMYDRESGELFLAMFDLTAIIGEDIEAGSEVPAEVKTMVSKLEATGHRLTVSVNIQGGELTINHYVAGNNSYQVLETVPIWPEEYGDYAADVLTPIEGVRVLCQIEPDRVIFEVILSDDAEESICVEYARNVDIKKFERSVKPGDEEIRTLLNGIFLYD